MSAPAANQSSPPAITMQRTSGSSSQRSQSAASSSISSGGQRVARLRAVEPREADGAARLRGDGRHRYGTSAFTPVTARPMISFWICEVPS